MKILLSHFSLYKKNGWGRTFEEAKGLSQLGHDVTLLCSEKGIGHIYKKIIIENVKVIIFYDIIPERFLLYGYGFLSLFLKIIYSIFTSYDICLSNSHRDNAYFPCAINRLLHHSKLVIEWWDDFSEKNKRISSPRIHIRLQMWYNEKREITTKINADAVVVLSSIMAKRAVKVGVSSEKITIIRGGCDVSHIIYIPKPKCNIKTKLGIPEDEITFGFIGNGDSEVTDIGIFLEAMLELKEMFNIKFLNYGSPLKETVRYRPELSGIIRELGWVDYYNDNSALSATDVFVLIKQDNTENQSGWPNKFGDYLACGRAIIVNPYGELIPFIQEWHPGIIKVNYSKESIIEGISAICKRIINIIQLGEKNRKIACSNTWLHRSRELEQLFIKIA